MKKSNLLVGVTLGLVAVTTGALAVNSTPFKDLPFDHWARPAIEEGFKNGVFKGYNDNTFRANLYLSRGEMAVILQRNNNYIERMIDEKLEQINVQVSTVQNLASPSIVQPTLSSSVRSTFSSPNGWSFSYPSSWIVSNHRTLEDNVSSAGESSLGKILNFKALQINFKEKPANNHALDAEVLDTVLVNNPASSQAYLKRLDQSFSEGLLYWKEGSISSYSSAQGVDYGVWRGDSPTFEAKYMVYVTQYVDGQGKLHWLELSSMGQTFSEIETNLKPIIDSLKLPVATPVNLNYRNDEYGFNLTFPETWKDYMAIKRSLSSAMGGMVASIDFSLPAQDDGLFNISVYTKSQWNALQKEEGPKPSYLGENSKYVFGYSGAQYAANGEMEKRLTEVGLILKSFKLDNSTK